VKPASASVAASARCSAVVSRDLAWRSWARAARQDSRASEPRSSPRRSARARFGVGEQVLHAQQAGLDLGDPLQGVLARGAHGAHPGRLLDEHAALLGAGLDDAVDVVLGDHGVAGLGEPGGSEHALQVAQADPAAVEPVLAVAVAHHPALDGHLGLVHGQPAVLVVEGEHHLGHPHRRLALAAGVDHLVHAGAAQLAGVGLAERPADGVDQVALAAAVGADHGGDAGFEVDLAAPGEGLEAGQRDTAKPHRGDSPVRGAVTSTC
jgi:hypothetical protein